jgi:glutamyl-tRNA reductase
LLSELHTIAFTHRRFEASKIGVLHIEEADQAARLLALKARFDIPELLFISTCNRVEISFFATDEITNSWLFDFLQALYPSINSSTITDYLINLELYKEEKAIEHAFSVASSIDSMIVGEREIITQVRTAYEHCRKAGLTGDRFRLLMKHVIETAKKVYTETSIATKPVSVVSLAYQHLKRLNIGLDARILVIGAGVTNTTMCRYLKKHGFKNFAVFNRTVAKGQLLADELKGVNHRLEELSNYKMGFDVIISCTGTDFHVISPEIYSSLLNGEVDKKIVIDIAIPQDLNPIIAENHSLTHISVDVLQKISNQNLKERTKEVDHVMQIIEIALIDFRTKVKERDVEVAMKSVPKQVKDIKATAINDVFKTEIENMDKQSREVLEKVIGYMEKKYISGPMKLAKEIIIKNA